ncbi:MAG TPA: hypothetical protein VIW25_00500, partial [Nitrososphaeraceae archaeon]
MLSFVLFSSSESSLFFLFFLNGWKHRLYSGKVILNAYISIKERHSQLAGVIKGGGGCLFYFILF